MLEQDGVVAGRDQRYRLLHPLLWRMLDLQTLMDLA